MRSVIVASQISVNHLSVGKHLLRQSFGDLAPIVHGNQSVRQAANEANVMFDHHHAVYLIKQTANIMGKGGRLLLIHPCSRFVEKQQTRTGRKRPRDFQSPRLAIGEITRQQIGLVRQSQAIKQLQR